MSARSRTPIPPPQLVLQPGWESKHDIISGLPYYAHRVSGETTWNPPFLNPQPPPPLPPPLPPPPAAAATAADPLTAQFAGLSTPTKSSAVATPSSTFQQFPPPKKSKTGGIGGGGCGGGGNGDREGGGGYGCGTKKFNILRAILERKLTEAQRVELNNKANPLDTSNLSSYKALEQLEDAKNGRFFIPAATLSGDITTILKELNILREDWGWVYVIFDFPVPDTDQDGIIKNKNGIPINATMHAFYDSYAQVISRQYRIDMNDAWIVATQSVVVVNAYPYTLPATFATDNEDEFKKMQGEIAKKVSTYIKDVHDMLGKPPIMVIGARTFNSVKDRNMIPPNLIIQSGSVVHTSQIIQGGVTPRAIADLYACMNRILARTQNEDPRIFTLKDAMSIAWTRPNAGEGTDDFIYVLKNVNGVILFFSQNGSALTKEIKSLELSVGSMPTQKDIRDGTTNTVLGLNITLVHFEDLLNGNFHENEYGNLKKKFGPRESPVLHEWKDNLLREAEEERDAFRQQQQSNYANVLSIAHAAQTP